MEIASCAVSLLNDIWVRVEHSLLQKLKSIAVQAVYRQDVNKMWGRVEHLPEKSASNILAMKKIGVAPNLHFPHLHQTLIYTHPTFTPDPNLHKPRFTPDPNLHKPRFTQTHFWTYISINPNLHNLNLHNTQIYTTQIYATQIYTKPKFTQPKFTQN